MLDTCGPPLPTLSTDTKSAIEYFLSHSPNGGVFHLGSHRSSTPFEIGGHSCSLRETRAFSTVLRLSRCSRRWASLLTSFRSYLVVRKPMMPAMAPPATAPTNVS